MAVIGVLSTHLKPKTRPTLCGKRGGSARACWRRQATTDATSCCHETIVIKQLFNWAAKNGYITRNLPAPVRFEKAQIP